MTEESLLLSFLLTFIGKYGILNITSKDRQKNFQSGILRIKSAAIAIMYGERRRDFMSLESTHSIYV